MKSLEECVRDLFAIASVPPVAYYIDIEKDGHESYVLRVVSEAGVEMEWAPVVAPLNSVRDIIPRLVRLMQDRGALVFEHQTEWVKHQAILRARVDAEVKAETRTLHDQLRQARQLPKSTPVKVIVAAHAPEGPVLFPCLVHLVSSPDDGFQYQLAKEKASNNNFETPMVAFDAEDGPMELFQMFDWENGVDEVWEDAPKKS